VVQRRHAIWKCGFCTEEGGVGWTEAADQAALTWSVEGGVLELTLGQESGSSTLIDDLLLEILREMPKTSVVLTHSQSSETSHWVL
jgi:hypothetical protein